MCIGVPGQIRAIDGNQAKVDVCGIQRDVDLTLVGSCDENGQPRLGQWVLVHVGFAMSVINEAEARDTLDELLRLRALCATRSTRYKICLMLSRTSAHCCMVRRDNAFC
ncbi:metallocenter assembly protein HypC [Salmonella enterica subsp. enterica serovar Senftenberg str. A4-543]|uniref:Hydrogenase maturation factor HypC n=3 Tax=Salmonella enterica TaxID=28901 RepID=G5R4G5_SALSE|nr:metallocenter assembly protein HypC [Salmonella enterica subsp. enterica serovar Senftenberg str. A4-543]